MDVTQEYVVDSLELHLFFARIMMEHALFIRGLLDPCEDALITAADGFAGDYRRLLETSAAANNRVMRSGGALELTRKFRDFKRGSGGYRGLPDPGTDPAAAGRSRASGSQPLYPYSGVLSHKSPPRPSKLAPPAHRMSREGWRCGSISSMSRRGYSVC